jgi:predicted lipoprotein
MKKVFKYSLAAAILILLLSQSVYLKDLKEVREQRRRKTFNAVQYAEDFWLNQLPGVLDGAVDAKELIDLFSTNMPEAINRYGRAQGISRVYAYLVKGAGAILSIDADGIKVSVREPYTNPDILIEMDIYIPGNAVRDASGLVDVSDFTDTMKFNEIGNEINKIIVKDVIRPFLDAKPKVGDSVRFIGATKVAQDAEQEDRLPLLKIVPVKLGLE